MNAAQLDRDMFVQCSGMCNKGTFNVMGLWGVNTLFNRPQNSIHKMFISHEMRV